MWTLKNDANKLIYKTETDSQTTHSYGYQRWGGSINQEYGLKVYKYYI